MGKCNSQKFIFEMDFATMDIQAGRFNCLYEQNDTS